MAFWRLRKEARKVLPQARPSTRRANSLAPYC
ncbi:unnamed protein product [Cylicostephanus goldi]|uniref:Uncharacterized protein n=1 Tax=Cylicostephanus goldi TaxID=71465 RepID=A0A3P6QZ63_CYLGO|nr:unnamed protein product [Cylicostephanus goldi]